VIIYLDSVIVIYALEGQPPFRARALARLAALRAAGDQIAVSDLTRLESRVKPIRLGDSVLLADFDSFFVASDIVHVPMPPAVYERATFVRAVHRFKLGDSLHLAAAVEGGCDSFLTNDGRLGAFPDLPVEVLP
jgi:predicted nucleic acid-binding protein